MRRRKREPGLLYMRGEDSATPGFSRFNLVMTKYLAPSANLSMEKKGAAPAKSHKDLENGNRTRHNFTRDIVRSFVFNSVTVAG